MSYATLSRYGDIILRSFAYSQADAEAREGSSAQRYNYASCRGWAVVVLLGFAVGLPALSGLLLGLQGTRMWKHATEFIAAQPGSWSRMWKTFSDRPPRRQANRNAKPQSLLDHASQRHGQA